ncbi:MAG: hypothetical protein FD187_3021 [bacterium]|nr:MAG: hypothetical protein FD142_1431 [bacterium]KAF0147158.1 MAG: hypothetical protein FD187_3021 [bacterium]KAF0165723.1 MAG: hypothetical protein FD158_2820 [bacterium]
MILVWFSAGDVKKVEAPSCGVRLSGRINRLEKRLDACGSLQGFRYLALH